MQGASGNRRSGGDLVDELRDLRQRIEKLETAQELVLWRLKRLEESAGAEPGTKATVPPPSSTAVPPKGPFTVSQLPAFEVVKPAHGSGGRGFRVFRSPNCLPS